MMAGTTLPCRDLPPQGTAGKSARCGSRSSNPSGRHKPRKRCHGKSSPKISAAADVTAAEEDDDIQHPAFRRLRKSGTSFAEDLNRFIDRELQVRYSPKGDSSDGKWSKSDIKLRIFREAFRVILKNVPGYRTVLARIRTAYDEAIDERDSRLREMDVMKSAMLKMQKDVEAQKAAIWDNAMTKVVTLHRDKLDLIRVIDGMSAERDGMRRAMQELGKQLEENHSRLLDEIDARRLVAYEFTQLSDQVEILRNKAKGATQKPEKTADVESVNDPVVLQLALDKCREALGKAQAKVTYMETVYVDVCPLRDYEALQSKYKEMGKTSNKLIAQTSHLEKQIHSLELQLEEAEVEKEHLVHKIHKLEKTGTPRMDWSQCAQFVPGGLDAWKKLTDGKQSREKLEILMEQLRKPEKVGGPHFDGLGTSADVPPYLRYDGQIYNRKYHLRDVRIIINDVWRSKLAENNRQPMDAYFAEYAERSFHVSDLRAEMTYNLIEGCKRYLHDPQVKLFYGVLSGDIHEDVYIAQNAEMSLLRNEVKSKLFALRSKAQLTGAAFCEALRKAFPLKSETDVMSLLEAAVEQLGVSIGKPLNAAELLAECEEGLEQKAFGREMGEQFRTAQRKYGAEILQAVTEQNAKEVTADVLKQAIRTVDNTVTDAQLEMYITLLLPDRRDEGTGPVDLIELAERLERFDIRRRKPNAVVPSSGHLEI